MVFVCITDSDNQGEVTNGSIIDRDSQGSFNLIITCILQDYVGRLN
jgi:hypothetical protein